MKTVAIALDQEQSHKVCRDMLAIIAQLHLEWEMYCMIQKRLRKLGEIVPGD